MDEILQRLTEVSIRQQQITKYLAARQGQTEQELDALHTAPARRVLLPDPHVQVTQLLPKMTTHDDGEALCFLRSVWPSTSTTGSTNPASQPEPKPASYPISLNIGFWMGCPQRPRSSSTDSSVLSQGLTAKLSGSGSQPGTVLCPHSRSAWYSLTSSHPAGKPQPSSRSLLCSGEW